MRKRFRHLRSISPSLVLAAAALVSTGCRGGGAAGAKSDNTVVDAGGSVGAPFSAGRAVAASAMEVRASADAAAPAQLAGPPTASPRAPSRDAVFSVSSVATTPDAAGAMLVRQGQASLEVRRVDEAVPRVRQMAAQFGGFVANTAIRGGREETRAATLELRVPSAQFDGLVGALGGLGKVESVSATAQDVGDEYVDLAARAVNARRLEARLIEMLASRTGKLSEVLSMEQELARVREEIERYEGRLHFLERRTSLSTLAVSLHEPLPLVDRPSAGPLAEALGDAWSRAIGVLAWCIASLGVVLPLALLLGGMWVAVRWLRRRMTVAGAGVEPPYSRP